MAHMAPELNNFPSNFFQRSSHNKADLLSYESKPTDKQEQNDWMAEKNSDGFMLNLCMNYDSTDPSLDRRHRQGSSRVIQLALHSYVRSTSKLEDMEEEPVQKSFSHPVILLSFVSRFALVR